MKARLWLLNLLLIVGIVMLTRELRENWRAARDREQKLQSIKVKPAPTPAEPAVAAPAPLQAAGYVEVAQQMLFSKDRNPNIVVEAPPPKVQPPFPRFHGVLNLGDGPMAILGVTAGSQKPFVVGEKTGEYELVEIGSEQLVFEWDGRKFPKKFAEMADKGSADSVPDTTPRVQATAAAPPPPPTPTGPVPGTSMGGGLSACNPGDSSPAGTVVSGMKKVITETPFSKVCRWEPVK